MSETQTVRQGEEIDVERLRPWLAAHGLEGDITVEQFARGFSNLTYRLQVGDRDLVLRRPPRGSKVKTAHDVLREYRLLSGLRTVFPRVPLTIASCDDPAVLDAPFYVMERVPGVILRDRRPKDIDLAAATMRGLSEAFIDAMADIHAVDLAAAGLMDFGRPEGYVERQVKGWTERYARSRTDDVPTMDAAATWLAEHLPASSAGCLIHNDFKYDNLVLDPADLTQIRAVLDWEMATVGDPLMDLGTSLAYWVEATDSPALQALPFGPTALPGNLTRAELAARYAARSGRDVGGIMFYYVFGLYKIAVVAQQIYYRYVQGLTRDPRFAHLLQAVQILSRTAVEATQ